MQAPPAAVASLSSVTSEDGSRWYPYPVDGRQFTSVTTVLGGTEGKHFLTPWASGVAAGFAIDNLSRIAYLVREKGRDVAVRHVKDQARILRERKADAGSYVHAVIETLVHWHVRSQQAGAAIAFPDLPEHLAGVDYDGAPLADVVDWMITGFMNFFADWQPKFIAAEMPVYHPVLEVAGTLDLIVEIPGYTLTADGQLRAGNGVRLCIDTKTGKIPPVTVQEQLAAYRRMPECLRNGKVQALPETDGSALLHLRPEFPNGYRLQPIAPANDDLGWSRFQNACELFFGREQVAKVGHIARPLRPDGSFPPPLLADLAGDYPRVPVALAKAGMNDLSEVALYTAAELLAGRIGIGPKLLPVVEQMLADHGYSLARPALEAVA